MYVDQLASATLVGTALSSNTASAGGGVYAAAQAHVTLTGVSLRHNTASNYGGGVHTTDMASVVATTPSFVGNTAARSGGGINLDAASTVTVTGGSATSNVVTMGHGGFVAVNVAAPGVGVRAALHAVFVSQNTAQSGGGVAVFGSYVPPPSPAEAECLPSGSAAAPFASATTGLTMKATTVTSNTASGGSGGGILVTGTGTELVATDCTVQQHQVTQAGAGIVVQRGGVLRAQRLSCLDNVANSGGCLHASAGMCGLTKPWRVARCPHHTLTPAAAVLLWRVLVPGRCGGGVEAGGDGSQPGRAGRRCGHHQRHAVVARRGHVRQPRRHPGWRTHHVRGRKHRYLPRACATQRCTGDWGSDCVRCTWQAAFPNRPTANWACSPMIVLVEFGGSRGRLGASEWRTHVWSPTKPRSAAPCMLR